MKARLILEDGTLYEGQSIGAQGQVSGEVVFNTSMTGYQEILTDPSYAGQIITMTYPLLGNYGVTPEDLESKKIHARALIVKELCNSPNNWRLCGSLEDFLREHHTLGIAGIDTRDLTRRLRTKGTMRGLISTNNQASEENLLQQLRAAFDSPETDYPRTATTPAPFSLGQKGGPRVVLMDFGAKANIARSLAELGCEVVVMPCWSTADEILKFNPDGILLSNGPGDPVRVPYAIQTVQQLLGKRPLFGICLGHQILGLACGANTYKLKFGHRGANHPVKELQSGRVYITSQNHGYAIDVDSLKNSGLEATHLSLNDGTVEGMRHKKLPAFSVQYHPEASPGPQDSDYLFQQFKAML